MLTCSRNGLTIAGTNLRDDAEPSVWDRFTSSAEQVWNSVTSQARQYYDLSTCQTGYNECVATSNQCTAYVAQASKDAEWSVKKANGIAVVAGGVVLGSLLGFAIGHASKKSASATAMAGRRRRRR